jgi:hypothetical protein
MTTLNYHLSAQVKRVMTQAAITLEELRVMIERAAIISHPVCNRRYHKWGMKIEGTKIILLRKLEMVDYSSGAASVIEDCEECEGDGCPDCGWIGQVKRLAI